VQGVPVATLDTDFWIDLPPRPYLRLYSIIQTLGGMMISRISAELRDGSRVDFCFWITGLGAFDKKLKTPNE
jgi:hypothetical protein